LKVLEFEFLGLMKLKVRR